MASKTFLLLALALSFVLLISSEVAAADVETEVELDGRGGYNGYNGDGGGYKNGGGRGGYKNGGGRGGYNNGGGRKGYNNGGRHGGGGGGCRYGCCGGGRYSRGCRCCSTFAEATAYKQTQN